MLTTNLTMSSFVIFPGPDTSINGVSVSLRPKGSRRWETFRLVLKEEIDRLGRAIALCSRFAAQALDTPLDLAGGVLNSVRRAAFHVLDQARDVALQCDKTLAKQLVSESVVHCCGRGADEVRP
jgi:hypothetical protein